MLYISVKTTISTLLGNGKSSSISEYQWHIGTELPKISLNRFIDKHGHITEFEIVRIQADGDELELIKNSFTNIPIPTKKRVVQWFGEMAQFIFANLE